MPNEHKEKHKKRHKKEKKKKHKKEKKSKKHKTKSKYSSTSTSSDSEPETKIKNELKEAKGGNEWGFLDSALSDPNVTVRDRTIRPPKRKSPDLPGQSDRELNPYWKNGGTGLPPTEFEQKTYLNYIKSDEKERPKLNFIKPGESSHFEINKNSYQRNWRKKEDKYHDEEEIHKNSEPSKETKKTSVISKVYTNDDLNSLAAKIVKAEIMGDVDLMNNLKSELETAKKMKAEKGAEGNQKETVVIADRGFKKYKDSTQNQIPSKRQKIETHASRERVRYFADDDKYSLQNLFEKEKSRIDNDEDIYYASKIRGKTAEELDDAYLEAASSKKLLQKSEERKNQRTKKEAIIKHKTLEGCRWCLDNRNQTKHLIVSTGTKCYLCLPEEESLNDGHCIIVPIQHETSMMHLDEDVWEEVKTYQKALTKMFLEKDQDVVFFENARAFKHYPHCYMQCVPMDKEIGDLAPIYFQKAISESESEWSQNKKLIDFRQKDLRRAIPKGLPYFAVSFGNEGGFAHIIEDEFLFKKNFGEEVIGGMMDVDQRKWRKPRKEDFRTQRTKTLDFVKMWKKFEFNENSESDSCNDSD